ncbi:MAG: hypothetical protein GX142_08540 [Chloroflexi bacterium]|nr:hypothetical protein [Chloroflexota bacterium]
MENYSMNSNDFFKALEDGALIGSRCLDCGTMAVPQRQICSKCLSSKSKIVHYSGNGSLSAFTVISVPSMWMSEVGYNGKNPYCVGVVALDEGPKISAQILDMDISMPENIQIGTKLTMTTVSHGEDGNRKIHLAFKPV